MAYIDKAYLYARFGAELVRQLADRDGSGNADDETIDQAIAAADARIDSYLRIVYDVPLADPPAEVKDASADLAFARLWTGERPEHVTRAHDAAVAFLRDLAAGRAAISSTEIRADSQAAGVASHTADDRLFTRDTLADF